MKPANDFFSVQRLADTLGRLGGRKTCSVRDDLRPYRIYPTLVCLSCALLIAGGCGWFDPPPNLEQYPGYDSDANGLVGPAGYAGARWRLKAHHDNWRSWEGAPIAELLSAWGQPDSIDKDKAAPGLKNKIYVWKQSRRLLSYEAVYEGLQLNESNYNQYYVFRNCDIAVTAGQDGTISAIGDLSTRDQACQHFEPRAARPATKSAK